MSIEAKKYKKKPVEIEAIQFDGSRVSAYTILAWIHDNGGRAGLKDGYPNQGPDTLMIDTLEGTMEAFPDSWVIRGVKGEFYPCRDDIFKETYDSTDPLDILRKKLTDN